MKLISVGLARSLWFLDLTELNPGGKDIFTEVIPALVDSYKFQVYPQPGGDFKDGMKFSNGVFVNHKGDTLSIGVTAYTDGVAVDTFSSTKDSDECIAEIMELLPEVGFAFEPAMIKRKAYLSQLIVRCSKDLNALNPKFVEFSQRLSAAHNGMAFGVCSLEFWPDPTHPTRPASFSFQKKAGEPLSGDRYWSQAGMSTEEHLKLLNELEAILA